MITGVAFCFTFSDVGGEVSRGEDTRGRGGGEGACVWGGVLTLTGGEDEEAAAATGEGGRSSIVAGGIGTETGDSDCTCGGCKGGNVVASGWR